MNKAKNTIPKPTISDIYEAREKFREKEPRDLFYRVAMEIMDLAVQKKLNLV